VSPPNGLLSINASPWAEVWIDGKPAGETPLANLSVSLGEHEIVFRHPDMGEQRRTALVRVDGVTRVSVNFQR
jgi:serine/threonine-protein kinase